MKYGCFVLIPNYTRERYLTFVARKFTDRRVVVYLPSPFRCSVNVKLNPYYMYSNEMRNYWRSLCQKPSFGVAAT